ncbi:MAG: ParB/RepB/Spo0J family partition protein, partial [SAR86 cluster bacterium]|nr:ParB/RepB/Spo0J family partition protein [SAR86 cluster bacterium]
MSKDKSSLGTGLDSLLGERPKVDGLAVTQISLDDLAPGQYQPRTKMHKSTLEELSQSIKEQGVLQPLVVRRLASGRFEIVVGERRWRAAQLAGLATVPAIIRDLNNDETAKIALIENLQREDLNALDQARGLLRLQREFNLSQEELAGSVGKSRSAVTNLLRLLNLSPEVQ